MTLLDPDEARLLLLDVLNALKSTECPRDTLAVLLPAVIAARRLPAVSLLAMHRILVSDCQPDASHEL